MQLFHYLLLKTGTQETELEESRQQPQPSKYTITGYMLHVSARKDLELVVSVLQSCLAATCLDWLMNDVLNCWLSCSCIWQL